MNSPFLGSVRGESIPLSSAKEHEVTDRSIPGFTPEPTTFKEPYISVT